MGLAENDWIPTLEEGIDEMMKYEDFIEYGKKLTKFLREDKKCDLVIALTHNRTHNDIKLAETFDEIDLILGGHDHVFHVS